MMRTFSGLRALVATVLVFVGGPAAVADGLVGQPSIIDGDTLEIHGTRIPLWGIDALEGTQLCRGDDSNIAAVRNPRTIWTPSSRVDR